MIDPLAAPNNKGVASVGQAKWMVKNALATLQQSSPAIGASVQGELLGDGKPLLSLDPPQPVTQEWLDKQRSPLTVGQLKALARPFYVALHQAVPSWLEGQLAINQTKDPGDSTNYFPWTAQAADDQNSALATVGQLKAVFALRFEDLPSAADSDLDGLPDSWEIANFGNLESDGFDNPDLDDYNNFEELSLGTDPSINSPAALDTDGDKMPDVYELLHGLSVEMDDSLEDFDGDRIPNIFEYKNGTSASDFANRPRVDRYVDPIQGELNPQDHTFAKIQEALDDVMYREWNDNANAMEPLKPYRIIEVKSATYNESLYITNIPLLIIGELGAAKGPVVVNGLDQNPTAVLESSSVLDGLVLGHASGEEGTGIEVSYDGPSSAHPTVRRRKLVNCIIKNNIGFRGGVYSRDSILSILHCTIAGNASTLSGIGVEIASGTLELRNSIVSGNKGDNVDAEIPQVLVWDSTAEVKYSEVAPNIVEDWGTSVVRGIIGEDARLTAGKWLRYDSVAIDAGTILPSTKVVRDIHGELRDVAAPDIGADEYIDQNQIMDSDDVPDYFEGGDDLDGVTASDEYVIYGTDPRLNDTDGDGLADGEEILAGFNPLADEDRDQDGMSDAWELLNGLNYQADDSLQDFDGDRFPNIFEYKKGSDPADLADHPVIKFSVDQERGGDDESDQIFSTISEAVEAARFSDEDGDGFGDPYVSIAVAGGIYNESISLDEIPMVLLGELGANCIIKGLDGYTTVAINSPSVLDGFIICHNPAGSGSGLSAYAEPWAEQKSRKITNCIITGNKSLLAAGINAESCNLDVIHCSIVGNSATIFWPGVRINDSRLRLWNSVVSGNTGGGGVQIAISGDSSIITDGLAPSFVQQEPANSTGGWINRDPEVTSTGRIIDAESAVIGAGGAISGDRVIRDIDGQTRNFEDPDVGADEFGGGSSEFADDDGDGMPNAWEISFGLDPNNAADALEDSDGDRIPNLWEFKRSTSPSSSSSRPTPDFTVSPMNGDGFSTPQSVQEAIDRAAGGRSDSAYFAIIEVAGGSYHENLVIPSNKKIALIGVSAANPPELLGSSGSSPVITIQGQCLLDGFRITRRLAERSKASGIVIDLDKQSHQIALRNLLIHGHHAPIGAAVRILNGIVKIERATMFDNVAIDGGHCLYVGGSSTLRLSDSILWGGGGQQGDQLDKTSTALVNVSGSFIRNGEYSSDARDPMLTARGWLRASSPAINSGTAGGPRFDIQGEDLIGLPDAGADEYVDNDNDGIPNFVERQGVDLLAGSSDFDSDGLSDLIEYEVYSSDPLLADTDQDGIFDGNEVAIQSGVLNPDSDGDEMPDGWEIANSLNPLNSADGRADTDGDGIPNLWEYKRGTFPLDDSSYPAADWVVNPRLVGQGNAVKDIQSAIDLSSGDLNDANHYAVISLSDGLHKSNIVIPGNKKVLILGNSSGRDVEIEGGDVNRPVILIQGVCMIKGVRISRSKKGQVGGDSAILVQAQGFPQWAAIQNSIINGHRSDRGAAIKIEVGEITLEHVTLFDNIASDQGNAVWVGEGASVHVVDSIIWNSSSSPVRQVEHAADSEVVVSGSFITGGELSANSANPQLNPRGLLLSDSPAIDYSIGGIVTRDIHGEIRVDQADSGADEFIDTDEEGIPNCVETGSNLLGATFDFDGDSLDDLSEYEIHGTNPYTADTDGDGLSDSLELSGGTFPDLTDSDGDGLSDGFEIASQFDPLNADENSNGILDAFDDDDRDGSSNHSESLMGSNPKVYSLLDADMQAFSNTRYAVVLAGPQIQANESYGQGRSVITDQGMVAYTVGGEVKTWNGSYMPRVGSSPPNRGGFYNGWEWAAASPGDPDYRRTTAWVGSVIGGESMVDYPPFRADFTSQFESQIAVNNPDYTLTAYDDPYVNGYSAMMLEDGSSFGVVDYEHSYLLSVFNLEGWDEADNPLIVYAGTATSVGTAIGGGNSVITPNIGSALGYLQWSYWANGGSAPQYIPGYPSGLDNQANGAFTSLVAAGGMGNNSFFVHVDFTLERDEWGAFSGSRTYSGLSLKPRAGSSVNLASLGFEYEQVIATSRNGHVAQRTKNGARIYHKGSGVVEELPDEMKAASDPSYIDVNDNGDVLAAAPDLLVRKFVDPVSNQSNWARINVSSSFDSAGWESVSIDSMSNTMSIADQSAMVNYPPPPNLLPPPLMTGTGIKDGKNYPVLLVPAQVVSRDRFLAGSITIPVGWESLELEFIGPDDNFGKYGGLLGGGATRVYDSVAQILDGVSAPQPSEQNIWFVKDSRNARKINFYTCFDSLGEVSLRLYLNNVEVSSIEQSLTSAPDFEEIIRYVDGWAKGVGFNIGEDVPPLGLRHMASFEGDDLDLNPLTRAVLIPFFDIVDQVEGLTIAFTGIFEGFRNGLNDDWKSMVAIKNLVVVGGSWAWQAYEQEMMRWGENPQLRMEQMKQMLDQLCYDWVLKPMDDLAEDLSTWDGFKERSWRVWKAMEAAEERKWTLYKDTWNAICNSLVSWADDFGSRMVDGAEKARWESSPFSDLRLAVNDGSPEMRLNRYMFGYTFGYLTEQAVIGAVTAGTAKAATILAKGGVQAAALITGRAALKVSGKLAICKKWAADLAISIEMKVALERGFVVAADTPISSVIRDSVGEVVQAGMAKITAERASFTWASILDDVMRSTYLRRLYMSPGREGEFCQRLGQFFRLMDDDLTSKGAEGWVHLYEKLLRGEGNDIIADRADDLFDFFGHSPAGRQNFKEAMEELADDMQGAPNARCPRIILPRPSELFDECYCVQSSTAMLRDKSEDLLSYVLRERRLPDRPPNRIPGETEAALNVPPEGWYIGTQKLPTPKLTQSAYQVDPKWGNAKVRYTLDPVSLDGQSIMSYSANREFRKGEYVPGWFDRVEPKTRDYPLSESGESLAGGQVQFQARTGVVTQVEVWNEATEQWDIIPFTDGL